MKEFLKGMLVGATLFCLVGIAAAGLLETIWKTRVEVQYTLGVAEGVRLESLKHKSWKECLMGEKK
jgi:hypothetical protein